jgi:hypothetical protein
MARITWKEMTKPVSLEEHSGETPRPATPQPDDSWYQLPQDPEKGETGSGYFTYGKMPDGMAGTKAGFQWGSAGRWR